MPLRSPLRALALVFCAALAASQAGAVQVPAEGSVLPDLDARWDAGHRFVAAAARLNGGSSEQAIAGPAAEPGELRQASLLEWERELGHSLAIRWDAITGSPKLLHARSGWLSAADPREPADIARELVRVRRGLFALNEKQVAGLRVESQVPLGEGGTLVHFAQDLRGRTVEHGHLSVAVAADGRVLSVAGGGVSGLREPAGFTPRLDAPQALRGLLAMAGLEAGKTPKPVEALADGAVFELPELALNALSVQQTVVQTVNGARLAWRTRIDTRDGLASYELLLDDATNQALRRQNLMLYLDTRGRAFRIHPDASAHDEIRFVDPDVYRSDESPIGWTEFDQTLGNNTVVRDDREADNEETLGAIATANPPPPFISFDFPFTGDVDADLDQSLTQLFYGINMSHDRFHRLGVTEAAGAYQDDNFGLPGLGDDAVLGDTQDGSGTNNANFNPQPDGVSGRMQMFIWDVGGVSKDSSNDVGVVIHEYGHGVTTRLVGGPANVGCLGTRQGGAMGEGWSDYFAASWLGDTRIGSYLTADGNGIRRYHLDDNPPGLEPDEDVDGDGTPDPQKDYGDYCEQPNDDQAMENCAVHGNGEIWSGFLWLVRDALVAAYGEDGAEIADRLVVEALKLTPCLPSMLDARDGVLLADQLLHGGAHFCLISNIAAERGMGFSATAIDGNDADPAESFDPWPECIDAGRVAFTRDGLEAGAVETLYSCEDEIVVSVTDGNAGTPTVEVTIASSSGDSEMLTLTAGVDPSSYRGSIATFAGAPASGDGVLQVAGGDAVNVLYADPDLGGPASAMAAIDCTARIRVLSYRIANSTCDDDTVAGFPELPGFLDQGETADIVLELANDMPVALRGGVLVTTDRADLFTVLPVASPLPLDLPAASGVTPGRQSITVRAVAVDDFLGATTADLQLSLLVPGFDAATTYDLSLELNFDYELQAGQQLTFDPETELSPPVGPDWVSGEIDAGVGNQWSIVDCWAATGTRSYRNGPDDCSGEYSDDQGRPWLAPPVIDIAQPNSVGARLLNLSFQHDVDLGVDGSGFFRFFDAEGVVVYLTADPAAIDPGSGFGFGTGALAAFTPISGFGQVSDNTMGFEPQTIDIPPDDLPVDPLQPFQFAWYFVPDFTPSQDQGGTEYDIQGEGYYLDDVVLTYDLVNQVPNVAVCTSAAAALAVPAIADPVGAAGCAGGPVLLDASLSEGFNCGGGDLLDYRFLNPAGLPVACFEDGGMAVARLQDPDGWGTTAECWDFPAADTTYQVEVRCQADTAITDLRAVSMSILDGTAILDPTPNSVCGPADVTLSALESAIAGCPGPLEYLFAETGVGPLDCDGDGNPDDFSTLETCVVPSPGADLDVTLTVRCQALPACEFTQVQTVPELVIIPVAEERDPANSPYCPGAAAPVTAASSTVTGCDGTVEYLWTSTGGVDTGWRVSPRVNLVLSADDDVTLTVRCSSAPDCAESTTIPVDVREGAFQITQVQEPLACPGDPMTLGINTLEPLQCSGAAEYLFIRDGVPFDCDGDGMPDDWSTVDTCETVSVDGGANYRVDVRCDTAATCRLSSGIERFEATNTGLPMGDPQGTLLVTKNGNCPPSDVLLEWADSGRMVPAFSVLRSDDPAFPGVPADHLIADVDATNHADPDALCRAGTRVSVRHYVVLDRNTCTGEPIEP
jgi:extracellular elastinolytic metalloproteinase